MNNSDLKFDLAFSFAQKDETLALQLHKLLKDRINCFIYTEEQKKIAGTDGEKTFNDVFSKESRVVAILYSSDWGKTPWTKIEETAIRNKGYEEGYDFVILIPTEKGLKPPAWLPKNRLWVGLERWGIESAASVIEARVQEFGGDIKELSLIDQIQLDDEKRKNHIRITNFINSPSGHLQGRDEFLKLKTNILDIVNEIQSKIPDWFIKIIDNRYLGINLWSYNYCLTIQWYNDHALITITDGYYDAQLRKTDNSYKYRTIKSDAKIFDINDIEENGWSNHETRKNFQTTKQTAETYMKLFFELVNKERLIKKW